MEKKSYLITVNGFNGIGGPKKKMINESLREALGKKIDPELTLFLNHEADVEGFIYKGYSVVVDISGAPKDRFTNQNLKIEFFSDPDNERELFVGKYGDNIWTAKINIHHESSPNLGKWFDSLWAYL